MVNNSIINPTGCVTRRHRTAFVLLLDLSGSMLDVVEYNNIMTPKSRVLSEITNKILQEFYMRSYREDEICDYYDIAIIGYSGDKIVSLLVDDMNDPFVSILDLCESCRGDKWINIHSILPFDSPELIDLLSDSTIAISVGGATPMYEAMSSLYRILNMWCSRYENYDSIAPTVYHISDGHPTDCDLKSIIDISNRVKSLRTNCSEVMLMNIKFDSEVISDYKREILFPTDEEIEDYPNPFVRAMVRSSSIMPESFNPLINELRERRATGGYRGFGCSISVADIISMINIGTLSAVVK